MPHLQPVQAPHLDDTHTFKHKSPHQCMCAETKAPPTPPSPEAPPAPGAVSQDRSFPVVVQARLGYDGSVSLNWNSARPCELAVGFLAICYS